MSTTNSSATAPLRIVGVRTLVFRAPLAEPVHTSFGVMHNRPALLVCVEDENRVFGWGKITLNDIPGLGDSAQPRRNRTLSRSIKLSGIRRRRLELIKE